MATIFVTGVPGFLATALLPRLLERRPGARAVCLVQPRFAALARAAVDRMTLANGRLAARVVLVEGDITRPDLGMGDSTFAADVREIFHLAAIYDLAVARTLAMRVNVEGTRAVLAFARTCPRLERVHHVSTCYVSGRLPGRFFEHDLDRGQSFNNAYEETKYLAELSVRTEMQEGLPTTIYRPAIVVGDSLTGETTKYDGPYVAFQWLLRQGRVAVMPAVGPIDRTQVNLVPRDFVVAAIDHLSAFAASIGRTYHLADPAPSTVRGLLEAFSRVTGRRVITVRLPLTMARGALAVPGLSRWMGIPPATLPYFAHPTVYDTTEADRDLAIAELRVPPLFSYLGRLVEYMREHPGTATAGLS